MHPLSRLFDYVFAQALIRLSSGARWLALLTLALTAPLAAQAAALNDTGITNCWNDTAVSNGTGIESDTGTHPR